MDVGGTVEVDGCCKDVVAAEGEGVALEGGDLGVVVGDAEEELVGSGTSTEEELGCSSASLLSSGLVGRIARSRAVSSSIKDSIISAMSEPSMSCWIGMLFCSATALINIRDILVCISSVVMSSSLVATVRWSV